MKLTPLPPPKPGIIDPRNGLPVKDDNRFEKPGMFERHPWTLYATVGVIVIGSILFVIRLAF